MRKRFRAKKFKIKSSRTRPFARRMATPSSGKILSSISNPVPKYAVSPIHSDSNPNRIEREVMELEMTQHKMPANSFHKKANKIADAIQKPRSRQTIAGFAFTNSSPICCGWPTRRRASQNDSSSFKPRCRNPAMASHRCASSSCRSSDARFGCAVNSFRQLSMATFRSKRV